ncbi:MAG TPA: histidine phosphatase family protein [Caldilineaceae bacterium]|nr:histidine phosphatase family protein [Caldilineaceae bacterium]
MQLYLIRHGQSYVNLKDWTKGNLDEGLTRLGQEQARRLAAWLPGHVPAVDAIYASTMRRARETVAAVAAAYGLEPQFDDRLREVGNNRLDHTPWPNDALPNDYADYWFSARPFSPTILNEVSGETFMHFRTRVGLFVEDLVERHQGQVVLVVAHGGVVESVFDHVFNVGPWRRCEVWDHNTAVSHFEYVEHPGREVWRLHYHNRIEHLIGIDDLPG